MSDSDNRFEMKCGVMLAIFASVLAMMELGAAYSDYGMNIAYSEKVNSYAWFNSKSIKRNLAEGQRDMLASLLAAGSISDEHSETTEQVVARLDKKIRRYDQEMEEITVGSAAVGQENWVQDLNGEMGKIIGANEWEEESVAYGEVVQIFDLANLFLQICLVVGAISLIVTTPGARMAFFRGAITLGCVGASIGIYAAYQYVLVIYA